MSLIKISGSEVKVDADAAAQAAGLDGGKRNPGSQFIDFVANSLIPEKRAFTFRSATPQSRLRRGWRANKLPMLAVSHGDK
jgi:hypothetical protein